MEKIPDGFAREEEIAIHPKCIDPGIYRAEKCFRLILRRGRVSDILEGYHDSSKLVTHFAPLW
jgi:hypothetical protein